MLQCNSRGFVLRKYQGKLEAFILGGGGRVTRLATSQTSAISGLFGMFAMFLIMAVAVTAALLFGVTPHATLHVDTTSLALGFGVMGLTATKSGTSEKKPAKIREMEANLKALAKELETGQLEMTAGPITPQRGDELEQKAQEMEDLQKHLDQYNKIAGITSKAREVEKVTLPGEENGGRKSLHTTPGHLFVTSDAFRNYRAQGKQGWSSKVELKGRLGAKTVRLTGDEAIEFERKAFDPNTLSDLGDDLIIETQRDQEIVRYQEPEVLTIRDVLGSSPTTSDSIRYVKHTLTTRAAASQATRGGLKNYLHIEFDPATVNVETIAVLSKVTEQDVDDAPRLVGYINGEMTLDIKVEEERQLLWGTGANGQLKGLFTEAVPEFDRAAAGNTVIDIIRKMRTDLRKKHVQPTFATIDPIDWEEVELTKGTDSNYVWGLITDLRGPRIWSLRVVESDAMTNLATGERRILVGDGVRGATVYDRHDVRLAIGYVDDDFARNLRTLRAEERIALAVKRVWAFEYAVTFAGP